MTIDQLSYCVALPRAEVIAQLNDRLRKTGEGGTFVITRNVTGLAGVNAQELVTELANYDDFNDDNNPHGERDMGRFKLFNANLYFKIDYFDPDLNFGSSDPTDPGVTHRLLTIMTEADL